MKHRTTLPEKYMQLLLGAHEALIRLGFTPDQIFVYFKDNTIGIHLSAQGRQFTACLAKYYCTLEEFMAEWTQIVLSLNAGEFSTEDLRQFYHAFLDMFEPLSLLYALNNRGFTIPATERLPKR